YNGDFEQSPDGNWVYGVIAATTGASYRGFVAPLTPTPLSAGITVSALTGTYADVTDFDYAQWLPDSSAYIYTASGSGDLREWKAGASSSIEIASSGSFDEAAADNVTVYGSTVLDYADYSNGFHFYGLNGTGTAVLDPNPVGPVHDMRATVGSNGDVYVVETEGSTPSKVVSIAIPGGNVASATETVLIPTVATGCNYQSVLSDTTFYQLCADTGTLNAYAESNATPSRQLTGVQLAGYGNDDALIAAAPAAERLVFVGSDYQMYSVTNDGAGSPVLVSSTCDPEQGFDVVGNWLFCVDSTQAMTRVSNLDGSVIDEPLDTCNMIANVPAQQYAFPDNFSALSTALQLDPTGTRLWSPGAACQLPPDELDIVTTRDATFQIFRESMTPLANLP
ncbi:MAG TPA: hypothetical protein VG871_04265, partial [Vicinamibacterales bacterium]|nr:hypothetical protein [Vicinamibacterales bacterium]